MASTTCTLTWLLLQEYTLRCTYMQLKMEGTGRGGRQYPQQCQLQMARDGQKREVGRGRDTSTYMYIRSLHTACEEVIHRHRLPNTDYYLYMYIPTGKHMNYQYMYMYAYTSKADCTDSYAENLILKTIFLRKPHGCKQTSEKGEGRTPYPIALSHTHTHHTPHSALPPTLHYTASLMQGLK